MWAPAKRSLRISKRKMLLNTKTKASPASHSTQRISWWTSLTTRSSLVLSRLSTKPKNHNASESIAPRVKLWYVSILDQTSLAAIGMTPEDAFEADWKIAEESKKDNTTTCAQDGVSVATVSQVKNRHLRHMRTSWANHRKPRICSGGSRCAAWYIGRWITQAKIG